MSVELSEDEMARRAAAFGLADPVAHTLVFYGDDLGPDGGGLAPSAPGTRMAAFEGAGSRSRYRTCALAWDARGPFFRHALPPLNPDPEGGIDGPAVAAGERFRARGLPRSIPGAGWSSTASARAVIGSCRPRRPPVAEFEFGGADTPSR